MTTLVRVIVACALGVWLLGCESRADKERRLTDECKKDEPCRTSGLCTGSCAIEPCRCVAATNADCAQTPACGSTGQCSAREGKCVIGSTEDCRHSTMCKSLGLCTEKAGSCAIGSADDCKRSELCTVQRKCTFDKGACKGEEVSPALRNPLLSGDQAPEKFKAKFTTTKGDFVVEITRAWAPLGADRFYNLIKVGFFKDVAFYRVVDGFVVQFGIHGDPDIQSAWRENRIGDDPRKQSNERGMIAFAMDGPKSRSTELVISLKDNRDRLDKVGVAPIGKMIDGLKVVESLYKEYGDKPPNGKGPDPAQVIISGNSLLKKSFPNLDYITGAALL